MQRPSSVKLAGVKYELYHPFLPTLRRMDMDDVTNRLPHEHSRTTTMCTRGESYIACILRIWLATVLYLAGMKNLVSVYIYKR